MSPLSWRAASTKRTSKSAKPVNRRCGSPSAARRFGRSRRSPSSTGGRTQFLRAGNHVLIARICPICRAFRGPTGHKRTQHSLPALRKWKTSPQLGTPSVPAVSYASERFSTILPTSTRRRPPGSAAPEGGSRCPSSPATGACSLLPGYFGRDVLGDARGDGLSASPCTYWVPNRWTRCGRWYKARCVGAHRLPPAARVRPVVHRLDAAGAGGRARWKGPSCTRSATPVGTSMSQRGTSRPRAEAGSTAADRKTRRP